MSCSVFAAFIWANSLSILAVVVALESISFNFGLIVSAGSVAFVAGFAGLLAFAFISLIFK